MFEEKHEKSAKTLLPFLDWLKRCAPSGHDKAVRTLALASEKVPGVARLFVTPQGGPWHCEGAKVSDHITRILTTLFAIEAGASLLDVEELARERDFTLDIADLDRVIRAHVPFLTAFALAHDLAKPETFFFDAARESRGAQEGFAQRDARAQRHPTDVERARYDKLFRAYAAAHPGDEVAHVAGFYERYGIETHYYGHANVAAAPAYVGGREAALALAGASRSHHKLLTELIRQHIDVLSFFGDHADAKKYEFLAALAGKFGLNVDVYVDLTMAEVFLDAVAGTLQVRQGTLRAQTNLVLHILQSERLALPRRHEARVVAAAQQEKQAYKEAFAAAGLSGDAVFALLGTPLGPERGRVMAYIRAAVHDATMRIDYGVHTDEMTRRIARARSFLAQL